MSEQTTQPPAPATSDDPNAPPEHHYHHEAEKTELEKWLTSLGKKLKPYANQILLGVIALVVVCVTVVFISNSSKSGSAEQWEKFVGYSAPEDFSALAEKDSDSAVGAWALLQAGKGYLQEGMTNALSNREVSDTRLNEAVEAFEKLLKNSNAPAKAREEALFGLGTAREVLAGGDPAPATEAYQKLLKEFPESIHKPWVEQRIKVLEETPTQEFYAWFRKQDPKPSDRQLPSDLLNNLPEPPETSDLDLLSDPSLILPPTGEGADNENTVPTDEEMKAKEEADKDSKPAKPFPAPEGEAKPEDAKPAQPAPEKPAEEAKPAETEKPAETPAKTETPKPETKSEPAPAETPEEPEAETNPEPAPAEEADAEASDESQ